MFIGIEVSTSQISVACSLQAEKTAQDPQLLSVPCAIALERPGRFILGEKARELVLKKPCPHAFDFFSQLGSQRLLTMGASEYSPCELFTVFLSYILEKIPKIPRKHNVVVTRPAHWNHTQEKAISECLKRVGIKNVHFYSDIYTFSYGHGLHKKAQQHHLVVDTGHSRFRASHITATAQKIQATIGHVANEASGDTLNKRLRVALVKALAEKFHIWNLTPFMESQILIESAKIKPFLNLKQSLNALVRVKSEEYAVTLEPSEYLPNIEPFFKDFTRSLEESLKDFRSLPQQEQRGVWLMGGHRNMIDIRQLVAKKTRTVPTLQLKNLAMISLEIGQELSRGHQLPHQEIKFLYVPNTIGISTNRSVGHYAVSQPIYLPLIHRGTPLPVETEIEIFMAEPKQKRLFIEIFAGESAKLHSNWQLQEITTPTLKHLDYNKPISLSFSQSRDGGIQLGIQNKRDHPQSPLTFHIQPSLSR